MDNELLLFDRINIIKDTINKYGIDKFYLSFSGGKDSTILHYLLDMAIPNNNIPRVFINTGIEYNYIVDFVKELAAEDERFVLLKPTKHIKDVLEKNGYPFKSKEHSKKVDQYWRSKKITHYLDMYINPENNGRFKTKYKCPKMFLYQFTENNKIHFSHLCCDKLKKEPVKKWAKENKKSIAITGMRGEEGGQRANIKGCIITDGKGNVKKFHPLLVVDNSFEEWFIKENKIRLCKLYYEPFNFKRTGCKGCPFALDLQEQLKLMAELLPQEKKQCEFIWKPVYQEYRRLNYRLKRDEEITIFD